MTASILPLRASLKQAAATLAQESEKLAKAQDSLTAERKALVSQRELLLAQNKESIDKQAAELAQERKSRMQLEVKVSAMDKELSKLSTSLSKSRDSSDQMSEALKEATVNAEVNVQLEQLLQNIEIPVQSNPDMSGVAGEVLKKIKPIISKQKRGRWDFEIVHGDVDGMKRIVRLIARPAT